MRSAWAVLLFGGALSVVAVCAGVPRAPDMQVQLSVADDDAQRRLLAPYIDCDTAGRTECLLYLNISVASSNDSDNFHDPCTAFVATGSRVNGSRLTIDIIERQTFRSGATGSIEVGDGKRCENETTSEKPYTLYLYGRDHETSYSTIRQLPLLSPPKTLRQTTRTYTVAPFDTLASLLRQVVRRPAELEDDGAPGEGDRKSTSVSSKARRKMREDTPYVLLRLCDGDAETLQTHPERDQTSDISKSKRRRQGRRRVRRRDEVQPEDENAPAQNEDDNQDQDQDYANLEPPSPSPSATTPSPLTPLPLDPTSTPNQSHTTTVFSPETFTYLPAFLTSHPPTRRLLRSLAFVALVICVKYLLIKYLKRNGGHRRREGLLGRTEDRRRRWRDRNEARRVRLRMWVRRQMRRVRGGRRGRRRGERRRMGDLEAGRGTAGQRSDAAAAQGANGQGQAPLIQDEIVGFRQVLEYVGGLVQSNNLSATSNDPNNNNTTTIANEANAGDRPHDPNPSSAYRYSTSSLDSDLDLDFDSDDLSDDLYDDDENDSDGYGYMCMGPMIGMGGLRYATPPTNSALQLSAMSEPRGSISDDGSFTTGIEGSVEGGDDDEDEDAEGERGTARESMDLLGRERGNAGAGAIEAGASIPSCRAS